MLRLRLLAMRAAIAKKAEPVAREHKQGDEGDVEAGAKVAHAPDR